MLAEGLDKKPLKYLIHKLAKNHFNCVRFTYAVHMYTRYANQTVLETFDFLNLTDAKAGIVKHNPSFLNMTHVQAFDAMVDQFGQQGVMVVLDNQVSRPTWCCGYDDGNGFFGDRDFDPEEWLQAITNVAGRFQGKSQVIGISTRNELRGPNSNRDDWYKYILEGGEAIHRANPDVLIIISGLGYASDLTYLQNKSLGTTFDNKLVYEAHWYPFSWGVGKTWDSEDINGACHDNTEYFVNHTGFVINGENSFPMFLGEFGIDQRGLSRGGEHFMACFNAYAADTDIDWGFWAWQGSYYYRENQTDMEETFGAMTYNWNQFRNPEYLRRMEIITQTLQDPSSESPTSYLLLHALSGTCMHTDGKNGIYARSCKSPRYWSNQAGDLVPMQWLHDINEDGGPIRLRGSKRCLQAVGEGQEPILSKNCSSQLSTWKFVSKSNLHLAAIDESGEYLCLQKESQYTSKILTNKCVFMHENLQCGKDPQPDPVSQWFKFVKTNV
ncbi:glycosyl hydrolase 5 family protein-like [Mercurialis annua]|uniref:glycosyl hydrolase 5 family protein-like n=1 Tax=Mercurialis annua TaxID=3986 RepID=UPI00215DDBE3|nr:glycosyl hydrolase 5 family protein-like [Mercurialis annua]